MSNSIDFLLVISNIQSPIYRHSPQYLILHLLDGKFTQFLHLNRSLFFVAKFFSGGAREIQKVDLHCTVWQVPVSSLPSRVTAR